VLDNLNNTEIPCSLHCATSNKEDSIVPDAETNSVPFATTNIPYKLVSWVQFY